MRKLRITVDGKSYEVEVELLDEPARSHSPPVTRTVPSAPALHSQPPPAAAPRAGGSPDDVPSPLAGRVVSLDCKVGDHLQAGDRVLTIEAMKMNTYINAPKAGKVTAILVAPGDGVEEGQSVATIK